MTKTHETFAPGAKIAPENGRVRAVVDENGMTLFNRDGREVTHLAAENLVPAPQSFVFVDGVLKLKVGSDIYVTTDMLRDVLAAAVRLCDNTGTLEDLRKAVDRTRV